MTGFDVGRRLEVSAVIAVAVASVAMTQNQRKADPPEGFEQLLPRGRIAAITAPRFVPAASADIAGESWVLGVVIDGQARAFSLNLLNHHEVVNDRIGNTSYAAVW
jgi:hypothetical protein